MTTMLVCLTKIYFLITVLNSMENESRKNNELRKNKKISDLCVFLSLDEVWGILIYISSCDCSYFPFLFIENIFKIITILKNHEDPCKVSLSICPRGVLCVNLMQRISVNFYALFVCLSILDPYFGGFWESYFETEC